MTCGQPGRRRAMSVLDQVRTLEQQVLQRLRELRPLVDEYRDLEKVAERLGLQRDDAATDTATPAPAKPSPQSKPAAKRRAKRAASTRASKRPAAPKPKAAAVAPPTAAAK